MNWVPILVPLVLVQVVLAVAALLDLRKQERARYVGRPVSLESGQSRSRLHVAWAWTRLHRPETKLHGHSTAGKEERDIFRKSIVF